ncbi:hypothetical protein RN001_002222 [Aquatica leii]|uniref:SAP domain-containing protein n=1 Tax=Aquatica leii TaxID=1421715 RepID=A0AAN7PPL8_9COLE|nr:hypothetical protein RN001_002222 [Aquatica leii]
MLKVIHHIIHLIMDASITLKPEDIPGALLSPNLSIKDHTKLQLQRWLACRCLKQGGTKSDLMQRVTNCIKAGTDNNIFLCIDGGKWYDAKRLYLQSNQCVLLTKANMTELVKGISLDKDCLLKGEGIQGNEDKIRKRNV